MKRAWILIILIGLIMVACNETTPSPTPTTAATNTLANPEIDTPPVPTQTPLPPTATPMVIPTDTPIPTPTQTSTPVTYGPDNYPANVNPLTGLIVEDPAILERRPVAVKVNIVPRGSSRPPWGLSFADIVYDYYHNAGYSRFFAIFYGQDAELVGPIRSGRLLDHELVRMYQSIFAYGSADQIVNNRLLNADYYTRLVLEGASVDCPPSVETPLCRYEPRGRDFLLGGTKELSQYITKRGVENGKQDLDGMVFNLAIPGSGNPGNQVYVRYSGDDYTRWDYDPASGSYLRFQDGVYDEGQGESYEPLIDQVNEQQIQAANVVILIVRHEYYQLPPNEIVDILLSGTGQAYAFRDGQIFEVTWNRQTISSVLYLTFPDGSSYPFKPGNTWFQVIGQSSETKELEEGVWRFFSRMP